MIVMKFGGTSVGDAKIIKNVAEIIKSKLGQKPVIVVSAVKTITNLLINLAQKSAEGNSDTVFQQIEKVHMDIIEELGLEKNILDKDLASLAKIAEKIKLKGNYNKKMLDEVKSYGERMSSKIVAAQLRKMGVDAEAFNAYDLGFITNKEFGNADIISESYSLIRKSIESIKSVPVVTGFIGKTVTGQITTLSRGGSDYTASIIGAAINAEEIQIWTDVDGVMSTDPKLVKTTKIVDTLSFEEASELAYFGARVLHPKTMLPATEKGIPVRVMNTFKPGKGTLIRNKAERGEYIVKAFAFKKNITLIKITSLRMLGAYGFLAQIFVIFEKYRKSIDVIATSEVSVSLTVDNEQDLDEIIKDLEEFSTVTVIRQRAIICAVGEGMKHQHGVAGRIFNAMGKNNINVEMISQGASEINITFIVKNEDADRSLEILHDEFFGA